MKKIINIVYIVLFFGFCVLVTFLSRDYDRSHSCTNANRVYYGCSDE